VSTEAFFYARRIHRMAALRARGKVQGRPLNHSERAEIKRLEAAQEEFERREPTAAGRVLDAFAGA
jgi:hypothetical protein